jgi:hypothetical protein
VLSVEKGGDARNRRSQARAGNAGAERSLSDDSRPDFLLLLFAFYFSDVALAFGGMKKLAVWVKRLFAGNRDFEAEHHWGFFSAGGGEGGHLFPTTGAGALIIFQILALVQIFLFSRTTLADEIWIDINLQSRPAPLTGRGSAL